MASNHGAVLDELLPYTRGTGKHKLADLKTFAQQLPNKDGCNQENPRGPTLNIF